MSKTSSSSRTSLSTTSYPSMKPEDYKHSPIHYTVVLGDQTGLSRLLSTLPALADPSTIHTEADSIEQDQVADQISSVIDRRDVPYRETPLHLAVRLGDLSATRALASAGADVTLQNAAGWNPLQEALCRRCSEMTRVLVAHHHATAWSRWRRRLPRVVAVLRRMRDFYMEMSFHFESSVIPFVGKIAPSDTYKIWKRDGNLRADTSLAGFDGLKIHRADRSFLFLGEGDSTNDVSPGSLLVLNRDKRKISNAFANANSPMTDAEVDKFLSQTSVYRPGMDMTKAELVGKSNWRWQEKKESVGEWKAKVYDVHNVVFSMRTRKVAENVAGSEQVLPLELDEDDDGFLVAEINNSSSNKMTDDIEINNLILKSNNNNTVNVRNNINVSGDRRRHSSFVKEEREFIHAGRRSVDLVGSRKSVSHGGGGGGSGGGAVTATKEKEIVKSLRPSVWLTEQFPLKTDELLPLLDILANKVKAVRRMRELLTTKFPPGTFPVKIAIPVVPTVRVVITFTKFVELQPTEQFFTPFSSPVHFQAHLGKGASEKDLESDTRYRSNPSSSSSSLSSSSSSSSWLKRSTSRSGGGSKDHQRPSPAHIPDPFAIPSDYTWSRSKQRKGRNSKPTKKPK